MYKKISNLDFIPKEYIRRVNDLEMNLKSYSAFTLMIYSIILVIIFKIIKKVIKKSYKLYKNISIKKIKEYLIILVLKVPI